MTVIDKVNLHYLHALDKHPNFADDIITPNTINAANEKLAEIRAQLKHEVEIGTVWAEDVMLCELWELMDAYADGRYTDAIEEIYDVIAVMLRMCEMIKAKHLIKDGGLKA